MNFKHLILIFLIILIGSLLLLNMKNSDVNSSKESQMFSDSLNNIRDSLGIPIIGDDWLMKSHVNNKNSIEWRKEIRDFSIPVHISKTSWFSEKDKKLITEQDSYFFEKKKNLSYKLIITYDFYDDEHWKCRFLTHKEIEKYGKDDFFVIKSDTITLSQSDSILNSWGLSRN